MELSACLDSPINFKLITPISLSLCLIPVLSLSFLFIHKTLQMHKYIMFWTTIMCSFIVAFISYLEWAHIFFKIWKSISFLTPISFTIRTIELHYGWTIIYKFLPLVITQLYVTYSQLCFLLSRCVPNSSVCHFTTKSQPYFSSLDFNHFFFSKLFLYHFYIVSASSATGYSPALPILLISLLFLFMLFLILPRIVFHLSSVYQTSPDFFPWSSRSSKQTKNPYKIIL